MGYKLFATKNTHDSLVAQGVENVTFVFKPHVKRGRHEHALQEAQVALREADGIAQALESVGDVASQEDTAVLACLAQQAIAAELAHLEAPELSISNMLQNASFTAQSFLPASHPLGHFATSVAAERQADPLTAAAGGSPITADAGIAEMLRKGLQGPNRDAGQRSDLPQIAPELPPLKLVEMPGENTSVAASLPLFDLDTSDEERPSGRRGRAGRTA